MPTLSRILRYVSLAILFGGSSAIVFAAIVLVKAATAQGIPVAEAAATNAPLFLQFSKVALGAGILLLISELIDFITGKPQSKLTLARYGTSILCLTGTLIFALGIVPPMEQLLPDIKTVAAAHEQFHKLHEISRAVFGASILFALISLLLPVFEKNRA